MYTKNRKMNWPLALVGLLVICLIVTGQVQAGYYGKWGASAPLVATVGNDQLNARLVADGTGGIIVVWQDTGGGGADNIWAQRLNSNRVRQWGDAGVVVSSATGRQILPEIVSDGAGGVIVTWLDLRAGNNDVYAQRMNAAGVAQWTTNGKAVAVVTGSNRYAPKIIEDGAGGAIIAWSDDRNGDTDIYVQHLNAAGTPYWTANGNRMVEPGYNQTSPQIISDNAGGAIIAWQDYNDVSLGSDIRANHLKSDGTFDAPVGGWWIRVYTGEQTNPRLTGDGEGGAIVAWEDTSSGPADIYAQRIKLSEPVSATAWGPVVKVTGASGAQSGTQIISDGAGGAILAWVDPRAGNKDIYAQRINASGSILWGTDGKAVTTASGDQDSVQLATDGSNGALIAWVDQSTSPKKVFLQGIQAGSTPLWTAGGVVVSNSSSGTFQDQVQIISDANHQAFLTWRGGTGSQAGTFAQRTGDDLSGPVLGLIGDYTGLAGTQSNASWVKSLTLNFTITDNGSGVASQSAKYGHSTSGWPTTSTTSFTSAHTFNTSGYYRIEFQGTDNAGNTTNYVYWLKIDATGPAFVISATGLSETQGAATWTPGTTINFTVGDSSSGLASQYAHYGYSSTAWPTTTPTTFYTGEPFETTGYFKIEFEASDHLGNETHLVRYLKTDLSAPTWSISGSGLSTVQSGASWKPESTVTFSAADPQSGVASQTARYGYNASAWPVTSVTNFINGCIFGNSGYYRLEFSATNGAGLTNTKVYWLRIDSVHPTLIVNGSGLSAAQGSTNWVDETTVTFAASDALSGIGSTQATYGYNASAWPDTTPTALSSGTTFTTSGYYRFDLATVDQAGNVTSLTRWVKIDANAPATNLTGSGLGRSTLDATWVSSSTIGYSFADTRSGLATTSARYTFNAHSWPGDSTTDFSSGTLFNQTGYYRFQAQASDQVGNSITLVRYLKIDATGPQVLISGRGIAITQDAAHWVSASSVTFTIRDALSGLATSTARYGHNPGAWPTTSATNFSSGQNFATAGYYRIEVSATDTLGNLTTVVRYLKIDTTALTIDVSGSGLDPVQDQTLWVTGSVVTFSASGTGAKVTGSRVGFSATTWPDTSPTDITSGLSYATTGYYRFEINASDTLGHTAAEIRWLRVDKAAPLVSLSGTGLANTSGTAAWVGSQAISYTVSDAPAGIATQDTSYGYNASSWPTTSDTPFSSGQVFSASGYYRFAVSAVDEAGNTSGVVRWLKLDTTSPSVTLSGTGLVAIRDEAVGVSSSSVTFTVTDGQSGVASQTSRYSFAADDWPSASATNFSSGQIFNIPGYYRFEISVLDATGNTTTQVRWLRLVKPPLTWFYLPLAIR